MNLYTIAILRKYITEEISKISETSSGKSAYEIAVENGFSGTEEEWLNSLKGSVPSIGENGHWYIDDVDTGIVASPDLSGFYSEADLQALTTEEILTICQD